MSEGQKPESRELNVRAAKLSVMLFRPEKANKRAILFIHGWKSSQKSPAKYASMLTDLGYTCLTFDLRGMGQSSGGVDTATRKVFLDDCIAAYDFLKEALPALDISIVGSSFGSYMACLLSAERPVASLVLRVPADFSDRGFETDPQVKVSDLIDLSGYNGIELDPKGSVAIDALSRFKGKVLIVQSAKDDIVPDSVTKRFVNAVDPSNLTHIVMAGAPHSLSGSPKHHEEFGQILNDWFTN